MKSIAVEVIGLLFRPHKLKLNESNQKLKLEVDEIVFGLYEYKQCE